VGQEGSSPVKHYCPPSPAILTVSGVPRARARHESCAAGIVFTHFCFITPARARSPPRTAACTRSPSPDRSIVEFHAAVASAAGEP
jgi:hypothetical protein